ncbi:hypothetical protein K503DRAFT_787076 [Rhizopogon vinicolor AM-OR11-026]|uniref:DUF6533 domain-containing protein n=1 Tax=Rhizopogon vinicolor AM-OR11-026 TaxID=1314800 RepID=A0A1B7MJ43_9AGAM|nr:hypothetical protein K503DRAFT_787076 [Rhizopogon vinicolor AM-OR11-026]
MSNEEVQAVTSLLWNNYTSSIILTLVSYEYLLQFEKEVTYVWQRRWSLMSWFYLTVRYFGLFIALISGFCYDIAVLVVWGLSVYSCLSQAILIWRLYALYNQSKHLLYVLVQASMCIVFQMHFRLFSPLRSS